jgi:hypothetical protein
VTWLLIELALAQSTPPAPLPDGLPAWAVVLISLLGGGTLTELIRRGWPTGPRQPSTVERAATERAQLAEERAQAAESALAEQRAEAEQAQKVAALVSSVTERVLARVETELADRLPGDPDAEASERTQLIEALNRHTDALERALTRERIG